MYIIIGEVEAQEEALKTNLKAVGQEIRAVRGALQGLDQSAEQDECGPPDMLENQGSDAEAQPRGDLQRAGLAQRLQDLKAKRRQWKVLKAIQQRSIHKVLI